MTDGERRERMVHHWMGSTYVITQPTYPFFFLFFLFNNMTDVSLLFFYLELKSLSLFSFSYSIIFIFIAIFFNRFFLTPLQF